MEVVVVRDGWVGLGWAGLDRTAVIQSLINYPVLFHLPSCVVMHQVRLIRLVRLLTLVRGIPALRVIIVGLIQGLSAVSCV